MKDNYRVLVLPDIHLEQDKDTLVLDLVLKFGAWFQPDETIILGDLLNFDYISHFQQGNMIAQEGKRLGEDFNATNKVLDKIDKFTKTKKVFLFGNHDNRLNIWITQHPCVEGLFSLAQNLRLKERGYEVYAEGKVYKIGHACFTHGWYWTQHHALKTVAQMGENIFYGHVHDIQSHTKTNYDQQPIIGQSIGCLCSLNPEYKKNRPNSWVNSFAVFYFFKNGQFSHYIPIIVNGRFNFAGKVFNGNK